MVGNITPGLTRRETGGRVSEVGSTGFRYGGSGLVAAAAAVASGGQNLFRGAEAFNAAEKARENFAALTAFTQFSGEIEREIEGIKTSLPADGAGYAAQTAQLFEDRYGKFAESLTAEQVEAFGPRAEALKQNFLTRSTQFSAAAAEGFALQTIDAQIDGLVSSVYGDPGLRLSAKQQVAELIAAAPISSAEKARLAASANKMIDGGSLSGTLRENYKRRTRQPFSDESAQAFEQLVREGEKTPDGRNSPKGAAGMAQVMPGTAKEIARELNDPNFPFDGSDEDIQNYMRSYNRQWGREVSLEYGQYYFNKQLRTFDGDLELALIAYNAGAGRARTFRRNGRDWASLPVGVQKETKPYVERVFSALGILREEDVFDGNYDLSFEQTVSVVGAIEDQERLAEGDQRGLAQERQEQTALQVEKLNTAIQEAELAVFNDPSSAPQQIEKLHEVVDSLDISDAAKEQNKREISRVLSGAEIDAQAEAGELGQGYSNPERYRGVTLAERQQARDKERQIVAAEQRQLTLENEARRTAAIDALKLSIDAGAPFEEIAEAMRSGIIKDVDEYDTLVNRFERVNAEGIALQETISRLDDPDQTFGNTKEDRDALGTVAQSVNLPSALKARDESAITSLLLPLFSRADGVVPSNVRQTLDSMRQSPNPEETLYAYRALEAMYINRPDDFLREFGEDVTFMTEFFRGQVNAGVGEGAAVSRMMLRRTPEGRQEIQQLYNEADKFLREEITLDTLRGEFNSVFSLSSTGFGDNVAQEANAARLYGEFQQGFRTAYALTGDVDEAKEMAMAGVQRQFGDFAGTIVKYPPSKYVKPMDGGHDWVLRQFERDNNIQPGDTYSIVNDSTLADQRVRQGLPPTHSFIIQRADGSLESNPGWYPDFKAEMDYFFDLIEQSGEDPAKTFSSVAEVIQRRSDRGDELVNLLRTYATSDPMERLRISGIVKQNYMEVPLRQRDVPGTDLLDSIRRKVANGETLPQSMADWLTGENNANIN